MVAANRQATPGPAPFRRRARSLGVGPIVDLHVGAGDGAAKQALGLAMAQFRALELRALVGPPDDPAPISDDGNLHFRRRWRFHARTAVASIPHMPRSARPPGAPFEAGILRRLYRRRSGATRRFDRASRRYSAALQRPGAWRCRRSALSPSWRTPRQNTLRHTG